MHSTPVFQATLVLVLEISKWEVASTLGHYHAKKIVSRLIGRAVLSIFRAWSQTPMLGARYIGFGPFRHYSRAHIDVMTNSCILPFSGHHHGWFDGVIGVRFVKYLWGVFSSIKKTLACPLFCPPDC